MSSSTHYAFNFPSMLAFMGIPGVGKTTIARKIKAFFPGINIYLEAEESEYPQEISQKFQNRDEFGYLDIYRYFRDMRTLDLASAVSQKRNGHSSIIDCYYDKLMSRILIQENIDWFINSNHVDYAKILNIARVDAIALPDPDIIIFFKISQKMHHHFMQKRERQAEVDQNVFYSQKAFLKATQEYAEEKKLKFFLIEQEEGVNASVQKVISFLLQANLIQPRSIKKAKIKESYEHPAHI